MKLMRGGYETSVITFEAVKEPNVCDQILQNNPAHNLASELPHADPVKCLTQT